MNTNETNLGWQPGGQIAVGHSLDGYVLVGLAGETGSLIRLQPEQALALATAIRATARRLSRRSPGEARDE